MLRRAVRVQRRSILWTSIWLEVLRRSVCCFSLMAIDPPSRLESRLLVGDNVGIVGRTGGRVEVCDSLALTGLGGR